MKADLHLHSEHSWDSKVPIKRYIEKAEELQFGAISITDHNNCNSHKEIKKLQAETGVLLIPGQEISTLDGHLLIYGWIDLVEKDLSMLETIIQAKKIAGDQSIVSVAAHPFDKLRGGKGKRIMNTGIDGIETLNASSLFNSFNKKASKFAKRLNLFALGNSDAHRLLEFGTAWNEIPETKNVEQFLLNLKESIPIGGIIGIKKKTSRFLRRKLGKMQE